MRLTLYCPAGCGRTVAFARAETWTSPDGVAAEFVTGRCRGCQSRVLTEPSQAAVEQAAARVSAATAMARVAKAAGDG